MKKKEKKNHNQVMMEYSQDIVRLGRKGRMEEALQLYESISKPSVRVWNSAIDACARSAQMEQAFAVFREGIAQKNLRPNVFTFGSLMSACARARQADRAIQLLRSMKNEYGVEPNAIVYSSAISACSRSNQYQKALQLLKEAERVNLPMSVVGYNAALAACSKEEKAYEEAIQLFDEMRQKGIVDSVSYGTVMAACETAQQWRQVLEYADELASQNAMTMDGMTLTSALHACQQLGYADEALMYLSKMKQLKLGSPSEKRKTAGRERLGARRALQGPDGVAYRLAISACARGGNWQQGIELLEEMPERNDVMAYTAAITGCEYAGEWRQAFALLERMRKRNVEPNEVTMAAVMGACATACAKYDDEVAVKKALQLLLVMNQDASICDPNICVYNAAIRTCGEARKLKTAFQLLKDATRNKKLKPTIITFGTLMTACERAVSVEGMEQVFELMIEYDVSPNEIVYGAAISCLRKASKPDRALSILRKMIRDGLKPNIATFNTVLKAQERHNLNSVLEIYKFIQKSSSTIKANRQTYETLIKACCYAKQPQGAETFLKHMRKSGFKPDVDLYTLTVAAYEKTRQPLRALRLLESMEADDGYDFYSIAPLNTAFKNAVKIVNKVVEKTNYYPKNSTETEDYYYANDDEEKDLYDEEEAIIPYY
eukprot:CAMPEP_0178903362 /NCGR_PEP_ID=MMETSP0786-20121207/5115_1 /TAXON_ID=186022 /ORGANISM="Thalassionema frauenfeldii, Strain CCMP 1798" /LENGTH=660 /DNA_ID=CAMNT_0020574725 /DNA_START=191 /DNA_END=2173 /DNA_ORIENTATION=+